MRERVARAGYEQAIKNNVERYGAVKLTTEDDWENQSDALKEDWFGVTDAVLDAMRVPTKEMKLAANRKFTKGKGGWAVVSMDHLEVGWQVMIDEARK